MVYSVANMNNILSFYCFILKIYVGFPLVFETQFAMLVQTFKNYFIWSSGWKHLLRSSLICYASFSFSCSVVRSSINLPNRTESFNQIKFLMIGYHAVKIHRLITYVRLNHSCFDRDMYWRCSHNRRMSFSLCVVFIYWKCVGVVFRNICFLLLLYVSLRTKNIPSMNAVKIGSKCDI